MLIYPVKGIILDSDLEPDTTDQWTVDGKNLIELDESPYDIVGMYQKFKAGQTVILRDGREAVILGNINDYEVGEHNNDVCHPLVAVCVITNGSESFKEVIRLNEDGRFYDKENESILDIVSIKETK